MKTLRSLSFLVIAVSGSSFALSGNPAPKRAEPVRVAALRMTDTAPVIEAPPARKPERETAQSLQNLKRGLKSKRGADALVRRSLAALEKNRVTLARHLVHRALLRNPDHAMAHLVAGLVAQLEGNEALAKKEYSNYLFLDPVGRYAGELRWIVCSSHQQLASR